MRNTASTAEFPERFTGLCVLAVLCVVSEDAAAHVSEQGLVLLLPTGVYINAGVLVVVLTLVLLLLLPASTISGIFNSLLIPFGALSKDRGGRWLVIFPSLLSLVVCCCLLMLGFTGTHDPLENLLPLVVWTVWWIGLPILHGLLGNVWSWINPWTGLFALLTRAGWKPPFTLPLYVGQWPGVIVFLFFITFSLADLAPDDPPRLAVVTLSYWCFTMVGLLLFGQRWLGSGECFSMMFQRFSQLSPVGIYNNSIKLGVTGWKLLLNKVPSVSASVFILVLLGCGSFDGFNETFAWLAFIGVNPLEFPGRSAVVYETVVGVLFTNLLLVVIYSLCVCLGVWLVNRQLSTDGSSHRKVAFVVAFCALSVSVLPIAFVYHFAHYLTSFLINGQYAVAAASDPLTNGTDLFNLGSYYVTTGFMNTPDSVKLIWLTQATAVVLGHVLSVLIAHTVAVQLFGNARHAIVSQAPLAVFMVVYTFIGLWLLAAPKGA